MAVNIMYTYMVYVRTLRMFLHVKMAMAQASSCKKLATFYPVVRPTELWLKKRMYGKIKAISEGP